MKTTSAGESFKIFSHAEIGDQIPIAENTVILSKSFVSRIWKHLTFTGASQTEWPMVHKPAMDKNTCHEWFASKQVANMVL